MNRHFPMSKTSTTADDDAPASPTTTLSATAETTRGNVPRPGFCTARRCATRVAPPTPTCPPEMSHLSLRGGGADAPTRDVEDVVDDARGRVHSIETFTAVDGYGIRCVVFAQGCEKRCAFCCNVDSQSRDARAGASTTARAILSILKRNLRYYARSGGGVTVSGGECMLQPLFVEAIARGAKKLGLTTCVDTAAAGDEDAWRRVLPEIDLALVCVKSVDPVKYRRITGVKTNEEYRTMRAFLRALDAHGVETWLRFVLMTDRSERFVEYATNGEDDLRALADLSKAHACVRGVELLPYHRFGEYKFERMGFAYKLAGMNTPSAAEIDEATAFLTSLGVEVIC